MRKPFFLIAILLLAGCQSHISDTAKADEINAAFAAWIADVNHKDMQSLLSLYNEHADLHPTLSGKLRTSPAEMGDYFNHFLALPKLHAEASSPHIKVFDDVAINDGFYQFSFIKNGKRETLKARYSFTYLKEPDGWKIIDHHSSVVPDEPRQDNNHK